MKLKKDEIRVVDGKAVPFIMMYEDIRLKLYKEVGLATAGVYYAIRGFKKSPDNFKCCFPSNKQIAEVCGLKSTSGIQNHINRLEEYGWLKWNSGGSEIGANSTYYFPKEEYLYTDEELHYISKVERRTINKEVEEIPAQDETIENNNIPSSAGDALDTTNLTDDKPFTPKGKVYDDDDSFVDEDDDNIVETPVKDNITKLNNDSAGSDVDYINEFYVNMHSYYNVNDESLKNNKTISKKVNDLVGFINTELTNNNIENIKAEKIINDIMKNNQKSFGNGLKKVTNDFYKCTYIITCVQNNFKDKKLKTIIENNKVDTLPPADDGFVDYMNDNYITLSNDDNLTKDEAINRIKSIIKNEEQYVKDAANSIVNEILKSYKTSFENAPIQAIRDIVNRLNIFYKREFLLDER
jgi:hypothetical protein